MQEVWFKHDHLGHLLLGLKLGRLCRAWLHKHKPSRLYLYASKPDLMLQREYPHPFDSALDMVEWPVMERRRAAECVSLTRVSSKGAATDLLRDAE